MEAPELHNPLGTCFPFEGMEAPSTLDSTELCGALRLLGVGTYEVLDFVALLCCVPVSIACEWQAQSKLPGAARFLFIVQGSFTRAHKAGLVVTDRLSPVFLLKELELREQMAQLQWQAPGSRLLPVITESQCTCLGLGQWRVGLEWIHVRHAHFCPTV